MKVTTKCAYLGLITYETYIYPQAIRVYASNFRTEIMSENNYDVQCYHWHQTLRLGKTNRLKFQ